MAEEYIAKQVEVAGQILCELIRKGIVPTELRRPGGMKARDLAELLGGGGGIRLSGRLSTARRRQRLNKALDKETERKLVD